MWNLKICKCYNRGQRRSPTSLFIYCVHNLVLTHIISYATFCSLKVILTENIRNLLSKILYSLCRRLPYSSLRSSVPVPEILKNPWFIFNYPPLHHVKTFLWKELIACEPITFFLANLHTYKSTYSGSVILTCQQTG